MRTAGRFLWDSISALAIPERKITALTGLSAVLILANAPFYDDRRLWLNGETPVSDAEWDDISHGLAQMEDEVMGALIGLILPHALGTLAGLSLLPCDGAIYNKSDYPLLYDALDGAYIIDASTFSVPDLRERFPIGVGGLIAAGDTGGESDHTLTVSEMPVHSHSEITALPALADLGTGVPVPSATPLAGVTGTAGLGQSHNNMPPYLALNWAIVAG